MSKGNIQKLPLESINKLSSGIIITDAVQCVLELVYNSLDAQATAVVIILDLKNYKIQVADNGVGLSKIDLSKVGERFMTSKYQSYIKTDGFSTYGYKGQAISSLLDVCKTFRIETKTRKDKLTSIKVFQNKIALPITQGVKGSKTGTTVTVEEFMWSMPVRRKRMNEFFDLEEIKMQLKYLAVVHHQVSFTLKNESKGSILFQTHCTPSMLSCIKNIFGSSLSKYMRDVNHKHKNYEITGFASKKQLNGKNVQLIYINKKLLSKGMTHKVVIDLMDRYGNDKNVSTSLSTGGESIFVKDKRLSYWAFILEISCSISQYEIFTNIRKSTVEFTEWKDVIKALQKAIQLVFCIDENISFETLQLNKKGKEQKVTPKGRKHGTSLLINAIKGAPVKRHLKDQRSNKNNKKSHKEDKTQPTNCAVQKSIKALEGISINYKKKVNQWIENQWTLKQNYCLDQTDSLESPIPKKKMKISNVICRKNIGVDNDPKSDQNQSFLEFCKWLKSKVESNSSAFKFHKSFMEFKKANGIKNFIHTPQYDNKETPSVCKKKLETNKQPRLQNLIDNKDDRMMRREHFSFENSKIERDDYHNSWKNMIPEVRSTVGNTMPMFYLPSSNLHHWVNKGDKKPFPTAATINQPEWFFSNYMERRSQPKSFGLESVVNEKWTGPRIETATFNTWFSHHQHSVYKGRTCELNVNKSLISWIEKRLGNADPKMFQGDYYHDNNEKQQNANIYEKSELSKEGKNNVEGFVTSKKDAMVQTDIPEVPSSLQLKSLCSDLNTRKMSDCLESISIQPESIPKFISQKDNWNESSKKGLNSYPCIEKIDTCKETESERLVWCTQEENEVVNRKSGCSFPNTISCIWTDSLSRLKDRSLSGHNRHTDSTCITQTLPIEDIDLSSLRLETPKFHLTSRLQCVPKGLSPCVPDSETVEIKCLCPDQKSQIQSALESCDDERLAYVKWQKDDFPEEFAKPAIPDRILKEMRQKAQKTMINCESEILTASLSYYAIKVHNLLHSFAFTKELLAGVEIIGQLDKKFIVAKMTVSVPKRKKLIILFDQHALDERIKLEEIMAENVLVDGKILSTVLNSKIECELNESLVQVLSELNDKINNFGIGCRVIDKKTIRIEMIPTILAVKFSKEIESHNYTSVRKFVRSLIGDAVNEFTQTRGALSQVPKIIHNLFCSEACHSAIKFNKALTEEEMSTMVNKLKHCKVPFQCAHGRPSVIPIIDLEDFDESMTANVDNINREKLQSFKSKRSRLNSLQGSDFNI